MFQDQDVETLTCLGLTVLQAKVYLALTILERATIKAIAKTTEIARQDIYRITSELQELSLIEKIITTPTEYRAIPMQDGVNILIKRKNTENTEMLIKTRKLLQRHKTQKLNFAILEQNLQFSIIPKNEPVILKMIKIIGTTQKSLDTIVSWKRYAQGLEYIYGEVEKALQSGVEMRVIVEQPKEVNSWPKTALTLLKNPSYKVRTIPEPPTAILGIYDKKEAIIATSATGTIAEFPALWSSNPSLIAIFHDYFELMWRHSKSK